MHHYPPVRRRRRTRLWFGVLLAVLGVGGLGYFLFLDLAVDGRPPASADGAATPRTAPVPAPVPDSGITRGDTILTCDGPDGSVFYTNARRCEDADLDNRVNVLPAYDAPRPEVGDCLGAQEGGFRAQVFLAACQEPFNQALELESLLLESPNPAMSRAGRRYCAFITEGVQAGCMATSDQFCFLHICQEIRERGEP